MFFSNQLISGKIISLLKFFEDEYQFVAKNTSMIGKASRRVELLYVVAWS